jgi:hypothetical protein
MIPLLGSLDASQRFRLDMDLWADRLDAAARTAGTARIQMTRTMTQMPGTQCDALGLDVRARRDSNPQPSDP